MTNKVIDSIVQNTLNDPSFPAVLLCRLHFSPILRYTNAYQTIYWDEEGTGDEPYLGIGNLGSVSSLTESSEIQAQTIQLTLSGIPAQHITDVFSTDYIGKPVFLWLATLDTDTYAVEGGADGPVLIFAGRMDYADIVFGKTAEITVNATSRLADWERSRGGRFNHSYQTRRIDSTDRGFRYIQALQNKPISWGGHSLQDRGTFNLRDVDRGGGGNTHPR